ncbi:unnamed protein product [Linum tenue]|uniref:Uncharacterized protein n=1 Tax=Linum tenue TaxID=586396 RepID=A0AAV0MXS7_9ROSI|nr:unnamed protein product [Linum tenue]
MIYGFIRQISAHCDHPSPHLLFAAPNFHGRDGGKKSGRRSALFNKEGKELRREKRVREGEREIIRKMEENYAV